MPEDKIQEVLKWVETQIRKYPFAEITVKFSIHDGQIKRLERGLMEKIL